MNLQRYNRQTILSGFGKNAQEKLFQSKVLVLGAGGLGCPVLQFLTAAGVGTLGIVDYDTVDISNLQRQILFDENDVGKLKTEAAKAKLQKMNSETEIRIHSEKLTSGNALSIFTPYQVIVDCTDNFQVRYLANDLSRLLNKPLVYGAIYQYEGQVSVFNIEKNGESTNYRDLFPTPPQPAEVPTCNEAGVLGTLSGIIGVVQANEVIKLLTGIGKPLVHKLWIMNILNYETRTIKYKKGDSNTSPETIEELLTTSYEELCGFFTPNNEIDDKEQLKSLLSKKNSVLVDVRNEDELPKIQEFDYTLIPLSVLEQQIEQLKSFDSIIFVCRLGMRSLRAVQIAKEKYPTKDIRHIKDGIETII
ncbi:HesA/MoeB/ThiF family protein [Apibacter raozihei]|uniref:HesA/MoeB/ThiF family protein n=1 Tax=Apibacter raozihei TaxID=2500547 RepID=UPI000FE2BF48|nr:HesA/MoeB/ThiF family protein [Apibacter raozihei]